MGQNNSTVLHSNTVPNSPRGKPQPIKTPPPRPTTPPPSPKTPNYAVPENRVLPIGAMQLPNKRQLLRPVSQELTKFHPEYADIFQYDENDPNGLGGFETTDVGSRGRASANGSMVVDGKENNYKENGGVNGSRLNHTTANGDLNQKPNNIDISRSQSMLEKRSNGHVHMNGHVNTNPNGNDVTDGGRSGGAVQRTNSLDRASAGPAKIRAHKRYPSATNSLANEASVIPEDPREHLYTHWRQDPFTNPTPNVTSLPVKNAFEMDYKMNLTYAQLAEHRRQKRMSDLEDKTGKKLSDLNADLQDKSTVPVSPFDRNNYVPVKPSASSTTGSSDTGVSKSKKRRAPPPPVAGGGGGGAAAAAGRNRDSSPGRLSLDMEPPADYDLDDPSPPLDIVSPWKTNLSRTSSSASAASGVSRFSRNSKGPAPTPPPAPPIPAPPSAPVASSTLPKAAPKTSVSASSTGTLPSKASVAGSKPAASASAAPLSSASARLIAQAKAEIEALKKLEAILKDKDGGKEKPENGEEKNKKEDAPGENQDSAEDETDAKGKEIEEEAMQTSDGKASPMSFSSADTDSNSSTTTNSKPEPEKSNSPRRLNSLLQHDILLAAQARGAKGQVKAKTPVPHVKPKDPAELFREELAKAATAREERVKSSGLEKEKSSEDTRKENGEEGAGDAVVFKSDLVKVKRKIITSEASPTTNGLDGRPLPPVVSPKPQSPTKESKPLISKSESDLLHAQSSSKDPSQRPRQRIPDQEMNALRKAASHDGTLELSDDDEVVVVASADEKASSSSRQFPEDWKPEDDLDSDDDIMDELTYSRNSAALESSVGFKSSIIPSKVDDLKSAKRKSSKSSRRESSSSTDEKNKFGSIRKFQKSVHKGVKQAFGSISKASGKLLRRNKSHEFGLEDVEGRKYIVDEDLRPKSVSVENGLNGHATMNRHLSEREESDEEDFDDDDLDDNAVVADNDNETQPRMMKRAGVAYVGRKGQIVVLPEFETVQVDEEGNVLENKNDEGRAPKIFKKKKKKFTYESTVRRHEKDMAAEIYAEEIRGKERQMELERRKQLDMEREFQRLRDTETQERLQRLQTAQLQQQLSMLQQQQQQLSSMQFMQPSSHLPSHHHPHHTHTHQFSAQPGGGLYTSSAGLGGHLPPVNMSSYNVQSTPFVTPATTTAATVGGYDVNYLSNYMRMMGIQPPTTQQQWAYLLSSVNGVHPQSFFDPTSSSKAQTLLSGSAAPDLSHLFPSKSPPYSDSSALVAQKNTLMNILSSGQLPQALASEGTLATTHSVPVQDTVPKKRLAGSVGPLLPAVTGSLKKSSRPKSMGALNRSSDDLIPEAQERSNPVYFSSDDEEEMARKAQEAVQNSHTRSNSRSAGKDRRRPHSAAILPLGQSSVYHDVTMTSPQDMAVTRVQVPDYRMSEAYVVGDDVNDDSDDGDSSLDDVMNGRVADHVNGGSVRDRKSSAAIVVGVEAVSKSERDDGDFKTVQFQSNGPTTSREASKRLPANVYTPIGYKPIAFNPGSPRTKLQTEASVDR
ncbi:titin homolog [Littorina saxatilis]|uniref:Uncharacterized protein n=1 Tax=Littorina saxatilis TaxID=31220 RepID=A0AAN9B341_9CAEN